MLDQITALLKGGKISIEDRNGEEYFVDSVYEVKGRAGGIKILIFDAKKQKMGESLDEINKDNKEYKNEKEQLKREISNLEDDLQANEEEHEDCLQKIDNALEYAESVLEIKTSSRHSYDRIEEIAEIVKEKIRGLEEEKEFLENEISGLKVDNKALAWQIEELEKWKENTLKDDNTILH